MMTIRTDPVRWYGAPAAPLISAPASIIPIRPDVYPIGVMLQDGEHEQSAGPRALSAFMLMMLIGWTALGMSAPRVARRLLHRSG